MLTDVSESQIGTTLPEFPVSKSLETAAVESAKKAVDKAVSTLTRDDIVDVLNKGGALDSSSPSNINPLLGVIKKLTTDSASGTLTEEELIFECTSISGLVHRGLVREGFPARIVNMRTHTFIGTNVKGTNLIIDPTIGQFIKGYSHIFVGTRRDLVGLVSQAYTDDKLNISFEEQLDPLTRKIIPIDQMLSKVWGIKNTRDIATPVQS